MKKVFLFTMAMFLLASFAFAQAPAVTTVVVNDNVAIKGTIIDNACADGHKSDLATFIKIHPKSCTLMAPCVASGYAIYADGALAKFDQASNAKVEEFLKKSDSKLEVVVVAKKVGDELNLVSIENQR